jgi:hypothetical protein
MRDEAPALVWPPLLELPPDDVKLVYLDLNHWISFAQASTGHPNGTPFVDTLKACKAAKSAGTAVFVLSGFHYMGCRRSKTLRNGKPSGVLWRNSPVLPR